MSMTYPFDKSWWIDKGRLLGGRYPGTPVPSEQASMIDALLGIGVTHLISLQEEHETGAGSTPFPDYMPTARRLASDRGIDVGFERFPIRDQSAANIDTVAAVLDSIDEHLHAGHSVYMHCWGGNGRTGTIAGCWLVRHGMTSDQALTEMHRSRLGRGFSSAAPENEKQRDVVRNWHRHDPRV